MKEDIILTDNIFDEISLFIKLSHQRNKWFYGSNMKIYMRKSKRYIEGQIRDCLDLASMEVLEGEDMGKGIFTDFLTKFIETYPEHNIFVESIQTERFALFFEKFGFKRTKESDIHQQNMYLLKRK
jgi:hypothetical protein